MTDREINVTAPLQQDNSNLYEEMVRLFRRCQHEDFEAGFESAFSKEFVPLIQKYGSLAIEIVEDIIHQKWVKHDVAVEALHYLGKIPDPVTHAQRLMVLAQHLHSEIPQIRDAAGTGLAYLDDPKAIPYLERAIEQEKIAELRKDLRQVLDQLEETLMEQAR